MNRQKIKEEAKSIIKGNIWTLLLPFIIAGGLSAIVGGISGYYTGINGEEASTLVNSISSLVDILVLPLSIGATAYVMKFVRKENVDLNYMFSFYKKFWPIFVLTFFIGLFTALWTILFIIPGIIAAISYSMSEYLLIDGNEDAMECIKCSKKMMNGYKMDYFVFNLSFIGWYLLAIPTLGLILIYVLPYVKVSQVLYYEELKKVQDVNLVQ